MLYYIYSFLDLVPFLSLALTRSMDADQSALSEAGVTAELALVGASANNTVAASQQCCSTAVLPLIDLDSTRYNCGPQSILSHVLANAPNATTGSDASNVNQVCSGRNPHLFSR